MMASTSRALSDEFSSAGISLIFEDPFFGHFLLGVNRIFSEEGPTLWVKPTEDDKVILGVNPHFWSNQLNTEELRMGGIKHEILHLVFKHLTRVDETEGPRKKYRNLKLFNIAADLVVNQYIKDPWLIEGCVTLATFSDLNLEKEQDLDYYYNKLADFYKDQAGIKLPDTIYSDIGDPDGAGDDVCPTCGSKLEKEEESDSDEGSGSGQGEGEEEEESDSDEGSGSGHDQDETGSDAGTCPDCGHDLESEKGEGKGEGEGGGEPPSSWENLQSSLSNKPGSRGGYHGFWEQMRDLPDAKREIMENWIDQQIVTAVTRTESTNTWGSLPGGIIEYLKNFMESRKSKVNWRRKLRLFTETSQQTFISNTFKRPSRRYKRLSTSPDGTPMYQMKDGKLIKDEDGNHVPVWEPKYPGLKVRQKCKLLIGIDTSGSLSSETDVPLFFNEIHHISKGDVDITIVEADTCIQRIYSYPTKEQVSIMGRGGTDFNEIIKFANGEEITHKMRLLRGKNWIEQTSMKLSSPVDGLIYFTDGHASKPSAEPKINIIWAIAGYGASRDLSKYNHLPGEKVIIEESLKN